jgi:CheY-like chemotaxis protein
MPNALFVGDPNHDLFRAAVVWLAERYDLCCEPSPADACRACRHRPPDLIVFGQSRPGQITSAEVESVHRESPLARLVALLGAWCEGEPRTGAPWPGVPRVYWHQFLARAVGEQGFVPGSNWKLPRTYAESERLPRADQGLRSEGGLVTVRCEDGLSFDVLSEVLARAGYSAVRVVESVQASGAVAGIWDCATSVEEDRAAIKRFVERIAPAAAIVLLGFPRPADHRDALACGAHALLGKPFLLDDLLAELNRRVDEDLFPGSASIFPRRASA